MSNEFTNRHVVTGVIAATLIIFLAPQADARGRSLTGPRGGTWSRTVTPYHNGGGNFGRTITTTRPDGQTAASSFNRSVSNGTVTDTHNFTGFNGKTTSETLTRTPGQGGTATYTGPNGHTGTGTFSPN
jgi:hypothetical protein